MDTGSSLTNLDKFVSGRYAAEAHGSKLTHWLMKPATAETLSLLKKLSTGSNESLISFVEDGLRIAGVPVITSTHVDANTFAWGVDASQLRYVVRKGTTVERFPSVTNDGQNTETNVAVKATVEGTSITGQGIIPQTKPGQQYTVQIPLSSSPPKGQYNVNVTVQHVPGETTFTHNTEVFPVTFQ